MMKIKMCGCLKVLVSNREVVFGLALNIHYKIFGSNRNRLDKITQLNLILKNLTPEFFSILINISILI